RRHIDIDTLWRKSAGDNVFIYLHARKNGSGVLQLKFWSQDIGARQCVGRRVEIKDARRIMRNFTRETSFVVHDVAIADIIRGDLGVEPTEYGGYVHRAFSQMASTRGEERWIIIRTRFRIKQDSCDNRPQVTSGSRPIIFKNLCYSLYV